MKKLNGIREKYRGKERAYRNREAFIERWKLWEWVWFFMGCIKSDLVRYGARER